MMLPSGLFIVHHPTPSTHRPFVVSQLNLLLTVDEEAAEVLQVAKTGRGAFYCILFFSLRRVM